MDIREITTTQYYVGTPSGSALRYWSEHQREKAVEELAYCRAQGRDDVQLYIRITSTKVTTWEITP